MTVYARREAAAANDEASPTPSPEDDGLTEAVAGSSTPPVDAAADTEEAADIEEFAKIRLQHSPYRAIRRIRCSFQDGVLTLHGQVPTYHYKQLAQTAICDIPGVRQIVNAIDVG